MNGNYLKNQSAVAADNFGHQLVNLQDRLEKFAYTLTRNPYDARDLLQETLKRALENKDKFAENTNLKAWTHTIMKNIYIKNYRKSKRGCGIFDNVETDASDPYSADSGVLTNEIKNEIEQLDAEFMVPFMRHVEGFKYKEIADGLNLKIGTVKSRIFFARKKLMKSLEGYN